MEMFYAPSPTRTAATGEPSLSSRIRATTVPKL
jgi:hypothetical protein